MEFQKTRGGSFFDATYGETAFFLEMSIPPLLASWYTIVYQNMFKGR